MANRENLAARGWLFSSISAGLLINSPDLLSFQGSNLELQKTFLLVCFFGGLFLVGCTSSVPDYVASDIFPMIVMNLRWMLMIPLVLELGAGETLGSKIIGLFLLVLACDIVVEFWNKMRCAPKTVQRVHCWASRQTSRPIDVFRVTYDIYENLDG